MSDNITVHSWTGLDPQADAQDIQTQADEVAKLFAGFVRAAKSTVHIAIYDFRLEGSQATIVLDAFDECVKAGVDVRVAYFQQRPERPRKSAADFTRNGGDPYPGEDEGFLKSMRARNVKVQPVTEVGVAQLEAAVSRRAIEGGGHLMHSKYIIRDGQHPDAAVWMGSANFTSDAWALQDNNVVLVNSQDLAAYYETDFAELWSSQRIAGTGKDDQGTVVVDEAPVEVTFSPGDGAVIEKEFAGLIASAQHSVALASMVISSGPIMGALIDALGRGVAITGVYDGPEMKDVIGDWNRAHGGKSAGKEQQWEHLASLLVAKQSLPYTANGPHNFMHNKVVVVDSEVAATGSFNLSENAAHNAENVLVIHDEEVAEQFETYIEGLVATYGAKKGKGGKG